MASNPRPWPSELTDASPADRSTPDSVEVAVLEPVVRTARSVRPAPVALPDRPALGAAARGAVRLARHLDVATSRRAPETSAHGQGDAANIELPWGVWPVSDDTDADEQVAVLGDALASYARMLRAKRGAPPPPPARGIPLVVRRGGGTAGGPRRGPGGLARSMVPADQPIAAPAPERRAVTPPRPAAMPARPMPTPRRPGGR